MLYKIYYVIIPKAELVSSIRASAFGSFADLAKPDVWINEEADRSYLTTEDRELFIKTLFVAALLRERSGDDGFFTIFGDITVSASEFDRRWLLVGTMGTVVSEELEDAIEAGDVESLKRSTNPNVATFLDQYPVGKS